MRITKVNIPEETSGTYGFKNIEMDRLGEVVLIAGKNGSGKTRLLNLLKDTIANYPTPETVEKWQRQSDRFSQNIYDSERSLESFREQLEIHKTGPQAASVKSAMASLIKNQKEWKSGITNIAQELNGRSILNIVPNKIDKAVMSYVPKNLSLTDSYSISRGQIEEYGKLIYTNGIDNMARAALPALEQIQQKWSNANNKHIDDIDITEAEIQKINSDYSRLKDYIKLFLNAELRRNADGHPTLFGKRIGLAGLSDGQIVLLQFCLAIYGQEQSIDNLVIFMDEPENHLHPEALIFVLDKIRSNVRNGQLFIATHSINVLAHFDPSCIWYMENNEISYAGRIPDKVLKGLLGDENEIARLSNFLALPNEMAMNLFAYECLFVPEPVLTPGNDPQMNQAQQIIHDTRSKGETVRILDFGMGRGRLLQTIYEGNNEGEAPVKASLDYYGFDIDTAHKSECEELFKSVYEEDKPRYFNDKEKMLELISEETIDLIILSNVFHEIDPKEWVNLFTSSNSVFKLLKNSGLIIIIEDQLLVAGEKAHSKGFLVFDSLQFKDLFQVKNEKDYKFLDYRKDGRLKAHLLSKQILGNVTADTRKKAIERLAQSAKDKIKELRKEDTSFKNGRLHAFWAQQLANSMLALEEF